MQAVEYRAVEERSMRIGVYAVALLGLVSRTAAADGASDLASRLQALRAPGPVAATLRLELRLERTLHHTTVSGHASVRLDVEEDDRGTHDRPLRRRGVPRRVRSRSYGGACAPGGAPGEGSPRRDRARARLGAGWPDPRRRRPRRSWTRGRAGRPRIRRFSWIVPRPPGILRPACEGAVTRVTGAV